MTATAGATAEQTTNIDDILEEIAEKNGGVLTPELVLTTAKNKKHPLHASFEWDNTAAAHKWRIEQAARLIRASKFVAFLNKSDPEPIRVRKWIVLPGGESNYEPRVKAMKKVNVRTDYINRKLNELRAWCNETPDIEELAPLRKLLLKGLSQYD
jgi:hypothetical protein